MTDFISEIFLFLSSAGISYLDLAGYILVAYITLEALRMILIISVNKGVALKTPHAESVVKDPANTILIVGDSTAVGVGAARPEDTIFGMLRRDFPHSTITNLGKNGAVTRHVIKQLKRVGTSPYRLIIISAGGNDLWHFISVARIEKHIRKMLDLATAINNDRVVLLFYANFANAPLFPFFIRLILKNKSARLKEVFERLAKGYGILLVDLSELDFVEESRGKSLLFAKDLIHPSAEGYRRWYKKMWLKMVERGYVYKEGEYTGYLNEKAPQ